MKKIALIIAGGSGTRFWPMSRKKTPKQFLKLDKNQTLLNATLERIATNVEKENIYIIGNEAHKLLFESTLPNWFNLKQLLLEPSQKNTAPAIAFAMQSIFNREGECTVGVFPADHHIKIDKEYNRKIEIAYEIASSKELLVTFGIKPTRPETGFGYILPEHYKEYRGSAITKFAEKPSKEVAMAYLQSNHYFWNSGMFFWSISTVMKELEKHANLLSIQMKKVTDWNAQLISGELKKIYDNTTSISIDYALFEVSHNAWMIPFDGEWDDLGTWTALNLIREADAFDNVLEGEIVLSEVNHSIVIGGKKPIVVIGIEDLIIVDTEDVLMICSKNEVQKLKEVVGELASSNLEHLE